MVLSIMVTEWMSKAKSKKLNSVYEKKSCILKWQQMLRVNSEFQTTGPTMQIAIL